MTKELCIEEKVISPEEKVISNEGERPFIKHIDLPGVGVWD